MAREKGQAYLQPVHSISICQWRAPKMLWRDQITKSKIFFVTSQEVANCLWVSTVSIQIFAGVHPWRRRDSAVWKIRNRIQCALLLLKSTPSSPLPIPPFTFPAPFLSQTPSFPSTTHPVCHLRLCHLSVIEIF